MRLQRAAAFLTAFALLSAQTDKLDQAITLLTEYRAEHSVPTQPLTDRDPHAKAALPVAQTGRKFTDTVFGSTLVRATDETMGGQSWRVASNAHLNVFNSDSSKFYVVGNGGVRTFAVDGAMNITPLTNAPYSQTEPTFSRVSPDTLYVVYTANTRTIGRYSFVTNITTPVIDLDTLGLALDNPRTYIGGVVNGGNPETLAAFFGGQGQDAHHYVWVRNAQGDHLLNTATRGYNLHAIAVDQSGRFVMLYPTNATPYQSVVWDLSTNTLTPVTVAPFGHDALGMGEMVNMDVASGPWDAAQWTKRSLLLPATVANLIAPVLLPKEVYLADHTSWNGGRLISSTYRFGANDTPWRAWDDEIIELPVAGGEVKRHAHHRSIVADDANPVSPYFWYQPIANLAPNGRFVAFTTNWEKTLGADPGDAGHKREDVFLLELR